jgi:hypothetical protein
VVDAGVLEVTVPEPPTVAAGEVAQLVADVRGPASGCTYQWFHRPTVSSVWTPVTGAIQDVLKLHPVLMLHAGLYKVEVTVPQAGGALVAASSPVSLRVRSLPTIIVPLASRSVSSGLVSFRVVAKPGQQRSAEDLRYRWYRDGAPLPDADSRATSYRTGIAGTYSVEIYDVGSPLDMVSSTATLSVRISGDALEKTAGSAGTGSVHTAWWVYGVRASGPQGVRLGFYALERKLKAGMVSAGRSLWVFGPGHSDNFEASTLHVWNPQDPDVVEHRVLDPVASERAEFSVLASKTSGSAFTLSGRWESGGDAALYGAPDTALGLYENWKSGAEDPQHLDLELVWDAERTLQLGVFGGSQPALDSEVEAVLRAELESALLKGE